MKRLLEEDTVHTSDSAREAPGKAARRLFTMADPDASWRLFDAFYEENRANLAATDIFGAPDREAIARWLAAVDTSTEVEKAAREDAHALAERLTYMPVAEFLARLSGLCEQILSLVEELHLYDLVLWLPTAVSKSNCWVSLLAWPLLRHRVSKVRTTCSKQDLYQDDSGDRVGHLILDDGLYSGEQMSKFVIEGMLLEPLTRFGDRADHHIIVAAVAASEVAEERVRRARRRSEWFGAEKSSSDESENGNGDSDDDDDCLLPVHFISEVRMPAHLPHCERIPFYFGYKIADMVSVPLSMMVKGRVSKGVATGSLIPGALPEKLVDTALDEPRPPYKVAKFTWRSAALSHECCLLHILDGQAAEEARKKDDAWVASQRWQATCLSHALGGGGGSPSLVSAESDTGIVCGAAGTRPSE